MSATTTTLDGFIARDTDKAILFSLTPEHRRGVWLPLSRITIHERGIDARSGLLSEAARITLPTALAAEKGLTQTAHTQERLL